MNDGYISAILIPPAMRDLLTLLLLVVLNSRFPIYACLTIIGGPKDQLDDNDHRLYDILVKEWQVSSSRYKEKAKAVQDVSDWVDQTAHHSWRRLVQDHRYRHGKVHALKTHVGYSEA